MQPGNVQPFSRGDGGGRFCARECTNPHAVGGVVGLVSAVLGNVESRTAVEPVSLCQRPTRRRNDAARSTMATIGERSRAVDAGAASGAASPGDEPDEDFYSRRRRDDCGERIGPGANSGSRSAAAIGRQNVILSEQSRSLESIPGAIAATADGTAASDGAALFARPHRVIMDGDHDSAFGRVVQSASSY